MFGLAVIRHLFSVDCFKPRIAESVTSLKTEEFDCLLSVFAPLWYKFYRIHTIEGKKRNKPFMNAQKDTKSLPTAADKLFFILVYLKNYTLQEMLAASFGFSQGQASKWKKALCPLLYDTLNKLNMLPLRDGHKVAKALEALGEDKCFQDVSERLINRPSDQATQKEFYSGKKKAHTIKNNFITTQSQQVIYLSPTHQGTMHDKKMADEDQVIFPDDIQLFQDSGFQGFQPENVFIVQPFKKPKNGELTEMQSWFNQYVATIRITVEHAINGIKRMRVIKDKCRHFCQQFRDQVICICTGLHNFRVSSPVRQYKSVQKWPLR